jgi:DNA-binding transcriptional LysR family regulator
MLEMHSSHTYMLVMNWGAFDLNLLIVFDAVMQERSVTRAGSRIGLSQPAMSHALNRLRYMLKDELFIRTPEGMVPTPRAESLAQPLRDALSEIQLALEPAAFDPAASDRRFALAVNNYAAVVLAPPLVAAVSAAAPAVHLDLRPSGTLDIVDRLGRGDLDMTLSNIESPGEISGRPIDCAGNTRKASLKRARVNAAATATTNQYVAPRRPNSLRLNGMRTRREPSLRSGSRTATRISPSDRKAGITAIQKTTVKWSAVTHIIPMARSGPRKAPIVSSD